ncbi:hypothetical protein AOLI_G00092370 [Acnodon oligacanthus]
MSHQRAGKQYRTQTRDTVKHTVSAVWCPLHTSISLKTTPSGAFPSLRTAFQTTSCGQRPCTVGFGNEVTGHRATLAVQSQAGNRMIHVTQQKHPAVLYYLLHDTQHRRTHESRQSRGLFYRSLGGVTAALGDHRSALLYSYKLTALASLLITAVQLLVHHNHTHLQKYGPQTSTGLCRPGLGATPARLKLKSSKSTFNVTQKGTGLETQADRHKDAIASYACCKAGHQDRTRPDRAQNDCSSTEAQARLCVLPSSTGGVNCTKCCMQCEPVHCNVASTQPRPQRTRCTPQPHLRLQP